MTIEENRKARIDRELVELLSELRVALPGVQVLFGFLLTVPFSREFATTSMLVRWIFFAVLVATTIAIVLFIAPSTYHRICFRKWDKERLLFTANALVIAGTCFLALAMIGVVFLLTLYTFGPRAAWLVSIPTAIVLFGFWYALPIWRRVRGVHGPEETP
jgi:hypothetical protein